MGDGLVRSVRCPGCDRLPSLVISPVQAFCANDDCTALMWDMTGPAGRFKAVAVPIDLSPLVGLAGEPPAPAPAAAEVSGGDVAAQEAGAEADVRAGLHRVGARCAGGCPVCDPALVLTAAQTRVVQDVVMRALLRQRERGVPDADFEELEVRFGFPGLQAALQMLRGTV